MYYIKIGNKKKFLECFDFAINSCTEHGFLAEQVDNKLLKSNWVMVLDGHMQCL